MPLESQAALETAVCDALRTSLSYRNEQCRRTFDGRPWPSAGDSFLAVWSGGGRDSFREQDNHLDEEFRFSLTLTLRTGKYPFDRMVEPRDDLEQRFNRIVELLHTDTFGWSVLRAANALAGFDGSGQPIGFRRAMRWLGTEDVQEQSGKWFNAQGDKTCGLSQTCHFGRVLRFRKTG